MPIQAIVEKDEESDRVVLTLQEEVKSMTEKEYEKWLRRYERNMCPADLYDEHEEPVAPI